MTPTSQIAAQGRLPYFVLIEKALRDEGTSYHYLPASDYCHLNADLSGTLTGVFPLLPVRVYRGAMWTTDAPFRETEPAIAQARALCVEMEVLYAFAGAGGKSVVCFAYVTNEMAKEEGIQRRARRTEAEMPWRLSLRRPRPAPLPHRASTLC